MARSGSKQIDLSSGQIRLINNKSKGTRNICFINSVLQLLRKTGFADILSDQLILHDKTPGNF